MKIIPPIRGIYKGLPIANLPPGYSGDMSNVRTRDTLEGRIRIGQRPGLDKWASSQIGGATAPIVEIIELVSVD